METVVRTPAQNEPELHLLTEWTDGAERERQRKAGLFSILLHLLGIVALLLMPRSILHETRQAHRVTPLIAPLRDLTQTEPNKGKISKEVTSQALLPRPRIQIPPSPPSTTRPAAIRPATPTPPAPAAGLPEPPKVEAGNRGFEPAPPPPPQIQPEEKPRLAFENPAPPPPSGRTSGRLAQPNSSVAEAIRGAVRGGASSGGLTVGDVGEPGPGGIGEGLNLPPSPGKAGSNLELLSDPMGVDFRPYLIRILASVRRNWFAVMPESAKLGRRGKVAIQFAVNRNGSVPKLVIVTPSGADALDRAAVAGISASNPFPPLPGEYKGDQIRLQFTFLYNIPTR